jgi:hypothetical protein
MMISVAVGDLDFVRLKQAAATADADTRGENQTVAIIGYAPDWRVNFQPMGLPRWANCASSSLPAIHLLRFCSADEADSTGDRRREILPSCRHGIHLQYH